MMNFFGRMTMVVKNLVIINVLMFLLSIVFANKPAFANMMIMHNFQSPDFRPHQIVTSLFMHAGPGHLIGNMLSLWLFGSMLEAVWGPKRFLIFYMVCGVGAVVCYEAYAYIQINSIVEKWNALYESSGDQEVSSMIYDRIQELKSDAGKLLGASGAVFGLLMGAAILFPNREILIYFAIPIKIKFFAILYGIGEFVVTIQAVPGDNIAHLAHLGGMLFGFIMIMIWKRNRGSFY